MKTKILALIALLAAMVSVSAQNNTSATTSTRANVGTGNNVMICSIFVFGLHDNVVFRAMGPSLAPYFPAGTNFLNPKIVVRHGLTGIYNITVSGDNNDTGIALLQVYEFNNN